MKEAQKKRWYFVFYYKYVPSSKDSKRILVTDIYQAETEREAKAKWREHMEIIPMGKYYVLDDVRGYFEK